MGQPKLFGTPMEQFVTLVTQHDIRYNRHNPYALAHYAGAISKARDLIKDENSFTETIEALSTAFDADFPPLKRLSKAALAKAAKGTKP